MKVYDIGIRTRNLLTEKRPSQLREHCITNRTLHNNSTSSELSTQRAINNFHVSSLQFLIINLDVQS